MCFVNFKSFFVVILSGYIKKCYFCIKLIFCMNIMKPLRYFALLFLLACCVAGYSRTACAHHAEGAAASEEGRTHIAQDTGKVGKRHFGDAVPEEPNRTIRLDSRFLFGVATSYADSVTYVTNISEISGMEGRIQEKTPIGIDLYTQSLKDFLKERGKTGYLCATYVCKSRKEAERKLLNVRGNVQRNKLTALQPIGEFSYKYISTEHIYSNEEKEAEEEGLDEDF